MYKPFVIAPTFLRSACAVGQIERHFFKSLADFGFQPFILSALYDIPSANFNSIVCGVKENPIIRKLDILLHGIGFSDLIHTPDVHYFTLKNSVIKTGIQLAKDGKIDYIHTISNPVSSHVMGAELKMKTGLPLVVQLFDPWHNNPFRKYRFSYFENRDKRMEKSVVELADLIIFPNEELLDSWAIYGDSLRKKMCVIPFCTEIPPFSPNTKKDGKLIISHIGSLNKNRKSTHFINALAALNRQYPSIAQQIQMNYVGDITKEEISLIESSGIRSIVNIVGLINENKCIRFYEESDMFLIVDIDCDPNVFYPSKLLKYFCYQKPILGLTKNDSVVFHELSKTGNYPFKYEDENALTSFLYKAVTDYDSINTNNKDYGSRFSVDSVCKEYISQIAKIL